MQRLGIGGGGGGNGNGKGNGNGTGNGGRLITRSAGWRTMFAAASKSCRCWLSTRSTSTIGGRGGFGGGGSTAVSFLDMRWKNTGTWSVGMCFAPSESSREVYSSRKSR